MEKILYATMRGKMAEKGLTQKKMAEKLGINETSFMNKINGKTQWKVDEIIAIMDALGCDFNTLFK